MRAVSGPLPAGDDWCFELKWDGMRLVARCRPGDGAAPSLTLWSRAGRDVTSSFPELQDLPETVGVDAVLDGEVVVFDHDRPSFERLQNRIHASEPPAPLVTACPTVYMIFDLLELEGRSLGAVPYHHRRRLLDQLVAAGSAWRIPPAVDRDGSSLLAMAASRGLEGIVAKRRSSPYLPGQRHQGWVKVKIRRQQEFVVGGWVPGQGNLAGRAGALAVGVYNESELVFAGSVGSGISDRDRHLLETHLVASEICPFTEPPTLLRPAQWVEPTTVVEVEYSSWPEAGRLRHSTYLGMVTDHDPEEVIRELPS